MEYLPVVASVAVLILISAILGITAISAIWGGIRAYVRYGPIGWNHPQMEWVDHLTVNGRRVLVAPRCPIHFEVWRQAGQWWNDLYLREGEPPPFRSPEVVPDQIPEGAEVGCVVCGASPAGVPYLASTLRNLHGDQIVSAHIFISPAIYGHDPFLIAVHELGHAVGFGHPVVSMGPFKFQVRNHPLASDYSRIGMKDLRGLP